MDLHEFLKHKRNVHFIGIGGSGMFPLVQILNQKGHKITGSDTNESDIIRAERDLGIEIFMSQTKKNIKNADLIVYSAAIMEDNEELNAAKKSGITTIKRSDLLGYLTKQYKRCVCVSGTHGKTTTTSMLTQIFLTAQKDPTAVIGGKLKAIDGYGVLGKSDLCVCEACEFQDTFLSLYPDVSVILNIDNDHLDYFKTMQNLKESFYKFAQKAKTVIYNGDDPNTKEVVKKVDAKEKISFGLTRENQYNAYDIRHLTSMNTKFKACKSSKILGELELRVPGDHNVINALAAAVTALNYGVDFEAIQKGIKSYKGAGRRFEFVGEKDGVTVVDDYAHHPTELKAVLNAAKKLNYKNVWVIFQPFTYSRTKTLLKEFADVLKIADHVILPPIMGSREKNKYNIASSDLADLIKGSKVVNSLESAAKYSIENAQRGDLIMTLGCGDVYKAAKMIILGKY